LLVLRFYGFNIQGRQIDWDFYLLPEVLLFSVIFELRLLWACVPLLLEEPELLLTDVLLPFLLLLPDLTFDAGCLEPPERSER
jgi:hypothetical protein